MLTKEFLRSVDLFAELSDDDAAALAALARPETYAKGQAVFREREAGDRFYVVLSGVVEVSKAPPGGGRPVRLARLERGETLGEMATFDAGPRSATATAAVVPETRLAAWDAAAFRKFLAERPRAAAAVLGALVRKLSGRLRATSEAVHTLLRALEGAGA
jgi:CRP-like cAMP-binding protein